VTALAEVVLCDYLRAACLRAESALAPGAARAAIAAVRDRLDENVLRVAVGGRLNAGKSTLVNALLGEKLAATDATECTTLVSWFRYGTVNRVLLEFADGGTATLPAQPLAAAIAGTGRAASDIASVQVESSNAILASDYTIVDTPGLDALSGLDAGSLAALRHADVLLYLMPHPGENDREALTALRDTAATADITAVSTIGVLSRIDQLGDGTGDPWPTARRLASRYGQQLTGLLALVVPVAGLIAETALGDAFTEADMRPLRALAGTDREVLDAALYTDEDFRSHPALPISSQERGRLLSLLGTYGITVALEEIAEGTNSATGLLRALRARSGIDLLLGQLRSQFLAIADALRARYAIRALDAASWLGAGPAETAALTSLREEVDAVRSHPRLRQLDLAAALTDLNAGKWQADPEITAELVALATGSDLPGQLGVEPDAGPGKIRELLAARIAVWRTVEYTSSRLAARHARAVREHLESLYFGLPEA
jgi:Dynamin family